MRPANSATSRHAHNRRIQPPYPVDIIPLLPAFLQRRRVGFTAPLRIVEELGIDRPTLLFVVNAVALGDDEGRAFPDLFNPYPTVFDQWTAPAAAARGAGLVDEDGGRWRATAKGRELAGRVRREADAYLATVATIPTDTLDTLASLLRRALDALVASPVPKDHLRRIRYAFGDDRIPLVALENAVFGLWQARDDCHMSAWREAGLTGPALDVLTRVWRHEAATEAELVGKLPQQRPEDVAGALAGLRGGGLVDPAALDVTRRGADVRQRIEDETDRRFFEPWPSEVGERGAWITARLAEVNEALKAAAPA